LRPSSIRGSTMRFPWRLTGAALERRKPQHAKAWLD
jgi:hypothetical protein